MHPGLPPKQRKTWHSMKHSQIAASPSNPDGLLLLIVGRSRFQSPAGGTWRGSLSAARCKRCKAARGGEGTKLMFQEDVHDM
eukprot:1148982-Pelagomonas_calceolata.AAC.2